MNLAKHLGLIGAIALVSTQFCMCSSSLAAADGLILSGLGLTPQSRPVPGGTVVLTARVANLGTEPAAGQVVVTLQEFPTQQTARAIDLQPGEHKSLELFIHLPAEATEGSKINVVATMLIRVGERDVIVQQDGRPATYSLSMSVLPAGQVMGLQLEPELPPVLFWDWPRPVEPSSYDMVTAARVDTVRPRTSISYDGQPLPLQLMEWDAYDLFVVADPDALRHPATVEAMRQFMLRGGRLWIMVDQVPTDLIQPLLGPRQCLDEVERVMVDQFTIEPVPPQENLTSSDVQVELEREVAMVRVLHSGGRVTHQIGGWPAAVMMEVGYGQLLLTMLESHAWIEPRLTQRSDSPYLQAAFTVRNWGTNLAVESNASAPLLPLSAEVDYPLQRIGNPVVPQGWVATALLGFVGLLALTGILLALTKHLTWIGWMAPLLAAVTSLSLLVAATYVRRDIPESVSRLQLINVADDGSSAVVREQAAVYLSRLSAMELESTVDGVASSSETITSGVQRFITEDFERWRLSNDAWPPGTWRYRAQYAVPTDDLVVRGTLTPAGLQLTLPADLAAPLEDPLLSFVEGDPLLCRTTASGVEVDDSQTVRGDRWIAGSILSAEQQRRLEIYQLFFQPNQDLHRPQRRLYGWTTTWPTSKWDRELEQPGAALVGLPILLERPAVASEVFIPHGLLKLVHSLDRSTVTSAYDERTGKWREEMLNGTVARLDFLLPSEVVPFVASSLVLELDLRAPQREVTIAALAPNGPIELARLDSPSLPWKATVTDPAVLQLAQDGRLEMQITVGQRTGAAAEELGASYVTWQAEHFHASLRGSVRAASSLSSQP